MRTRRVIIFVALLATLATGCGDDSIDRVENYQDPGKTKMGQPTGEVQVIPMGEDEYDVYLRCDGLGNRIYSSPRGLFVKTDPRCPGGVATPDTSG